MKSMLIVLTSIISFFIILIRPTIPGYEFMVLFPIVYLWCYLLFMNPVIKRTGSIVGHILSIYGVIRYIITPTLVSIVGAGRSSYFLTSNTDSIQKATFLMVYELIILSMFLYIFIVSKNLNIKVPLEQEIKLKGKKFVYVVLGIISVFLILMIPSIRENLSFLIIKTSAGIRVNEDLESYLMLLRQIVLTAIVMLFVTLASITKKNYNKFGKIKYFYYAILVAFVNISIIIGERRIMQIYTAFATAYILITLYPQFRKNIIKIILTITVVIVALMSAYKFLNVFMFDSYTDAIASSDLDLANYSVLMQSYFYGPQNVAVSVNLVQINLQPISRLIYDVGRSTMGVNFLVKDMMMTTSDIFNSYIYGKFMPSGHPVSGIGYGYLYFGAVLSPCLSVIFLNLAIKVEYLMKTTTSLEMKYIYSYTLVRLAEPFSSIPAKINIATLVLISWGTVYVVAYIIKVITSRIIHKNIVVSHHRNCKIVR